MVVAKFEEAHDIRARGVYDLVCSPSFYDNNGKFRNRHRQWSLCTVGGLQRSLHRKGVVDIHSFCRIHPAAGAHDFLLFSHYLLTAHQGKKDLSSLSFSVT